mmetsp:Transcript_39575/g.77355  ORF Transcript_39575/g.77355 Transcript_39575/m.77355 type:complete len:207 (+) Transcript_39575:261-881(+)
MGHIFATSPVTAPLCLQPADVALEGKQGGALVHEILDVIVGDLRDVDRSDHPQHPLFLAIIRFDRAVRDVPSDDQPDVVLVLHLPDTGLVVARHDEFGIGAVGQLHGDEDVDHPGPGGVAMDARPGVAFGQGEDAHAVHREMRLPVKFPEGVEDHVKISSAQRRQFLFVGGLVAGVEPGVVGHVVHPGAVDLEEAGAGTAAVGEVL